MSEKTIVYPLSMGVNSQTIGNLTDLTTTNKINVVASINEVNSKFPVSIANGGTGGTTATAARTNLEIRKGFTLYSNSSGSQSSITLSDNISNYALVRVHYRDDNWCWNGLIATSPPQNEGREMLLSTSSISQYGKLYVKSAQINISGSTVTWWSTHYGFYSFEDTKTAHGDITVNQIYIHEIVGYKY